MSGVQTLQTAYACCAGTITLMLVFAFGKLYDGEHFLTDCRYELAEYIIHNNAAIYGRRAQWGN
jgi:hypothetical protein